MFEKVKNFIVEEEGYTAESLTWTAILGIGAATVVFGLYDAARSQGGNVRADMNSLITIPELPEAGEKLNEVQGETGAVTGVELEGSGGSSN